MSLLVNRLRYVTFLCCLITSLVALFAFALRGLIDTKRRISDTEQSLTRSHQIGQCLRDFSSHFDVFEDTFYSERHSAPNLETFVRGSGWTTADLLQLDSLTYDRPFQQIRLHTLHRVVGARIRLMQSVLRRGAQRNVPSIEQIFKGRERGDEQVAAITAAIRNEEFQRIIKQTAAADGAIRGTEVRIVAALWMVIVIIGICTGITVSHLLSRTRSETSLKEANSLLSKERESLSAVTMFLSEVVNAKFNVDDIMTLVAERTQDLTGATGAAIELLDAGDLVYRTSTGNLATSRGRRLDPSTSFSGFALRSGSIQKCDDADVDGRVDRDLCRQLGIRSMVCVPLQLEGEFAGVLKVSSSIPHAFDGHTLEILELMGSVIATAMSRAAQFQANEALLAQRTDALASLEAAKAEVTLQLNNVEDLNVVLQFQYQELQKANDQLEALATTDGLTGLKNHRAFQERLREEFQRAVRYQTPLSVVLIDVDNFKRYNDTFGHPAGDAVLSKVSRIMEGIKRKTDLAARYGGEEFVLVLPLTPSDAALVMAERCRAEIEGAAWDKRSITASFGVASLTPSIVDAAELIERADAALYAAKSSGRNCVACDRSNEMPILRLAA